jgi:PP-loop superfamily ATP-utilizing enzyme
MKYIEAGADETSSSMLRFARAESMIKRIAVTKRWSVSSGKDLAIVAVIIPKRGLNDKLKNNLTTATKSAVP